MVKILLLSSVLAAFILLICVVLGARALSRVAMRFLR